jgi:MFS family permease
VVFTAASAGCALAPTGATLIAARVVQGLGGAVLAPLSLTILTAAVPAARRAAMLGVWGGLAGLAVATGPLIGGAVAQGLDWQWIFWVNVPIGFVAAALSRIRLTETYGEHARVDVLGVALVAAGAGALTWTLIEGPAVGWSSPRVLAAAITGIALMVRSPGGSDGSPLRCCRCGCSVTWASLPRTRPRSA